MTLFPNAQHLINIGCMVMVHLFLNFLVRLADF